ncbi:flagellar basal body P-ring formation chaperone FlgA [Marilutibacter alkalisoli]|nr:flagellar basal body P-ring formation chaperone FlgA [Lysobacter alkalisoli]
MMLAIVMLLASGDAPAVQHLPAMEIEHAVASGLRSQLDTVGSTARVRIEGRVGDQAIPAGTVDIDVGSVGGRLPRPRVGVPVQIRVDGRPVRRMTVWAAMEDRRAVLTYATDVAVDIEASGLSLQLAEVDMTCCTDSEVASPEAIKEMRTARAVRAGQPVMTRDFEPVPAVLAQSEVAIEVQAGSVRLSTRGVALQDGGIGDRIAVRPRHSREAISSRVTAKQKVRVE